VKTGWSDFLAESSKEGCGSRRAVLPVVVVVLMMMMMTDSLKYVRTDSFQICTHSSCVIIFSFHLCCINYAVEQHC
jgi:hypothetical protein